MKLISAEGLQKALTDRKTEVLNLHSENQSYYCESYTKALRDVSEIIDDMVDARPVDDACSIKDSGDRRQFDTGAVRDMHEGKGRFDLMPLGVIADWIENEVFKLANKILFETDTEHKKTYALMMLDEFCRENDMDFYGTLLETAKQYENGARKYGERNWEKGIPTHSFIDSALRHYTKVCAGWTDEPHKAAFVFNMLGYVWTLENKPELDDFVIWVE